MRSLIHELHGVGKVRYRGLQSPDFKPPVTAPPSLLLHPGWRAANASLRIAPKINPDEPGARSTRNSLSCFSGHNSPPARKRAHNSHTRCGEDQILSGFERSVIDRGNPVA